MRRICAFLGETFEPAMFAYRDRLDLVPERERNVHGTLLRPISAGTIGNWRRLAAVECFLLEASMHASLKRLGYPLRFGGWAWRPLLAVTCRLLHVTAPLLKFGIPALQRRGLLRRVVYV